MEKYVIFAALDCKNENLLYISNTNPICWSSDINDAKNYDSLEDAKTEIIDEFGIFRNIILNTDMVYISILAIMDTNQRKITIIMDSKGNLLP